MMSSLQQVKHSLFKLSASTRHRHIRITGAGFKRPPSAQIHDDDKEQLLLEQHDESNEEMEAPLGML